MNITELRENSTITVGNLMEVLKDQSFKVFAGRYEGLQFFTIRMGDWKFRFVLSYKFKQDLTAEQLEQVVFKHLTGTDSKVNLESIVAAEGTTVSVTKVK